MDAGDLGVNGSISDEDLSAELRGLQECSSSNSDKDLQPLNRGKLSYCLIRQLATQLHLLAWIGDVDPKGRLTLQSEAALGDEQQTGIRRSQRPTTARGQRTKMGKSWNSKE